MSTPVCAIHGKEMKMGRYGYFCATPVEKAGDKVTKWCDYKVEDSVKTVPEVVPAAIDQKTKEIREILTKERGSVSDRIERQHSQHMALLEFQIQGVTTFTTQDLIEKISWYQHDIDSSANAEGD